MVDESTSIPAPPPIEGEQKDLERAPVKKPKSVSAEDLFKEAETEKKFVQTPGEEAQAEGEEPQLEKVLSYPVILLITINSIMGTGIFFLPAVGAGIAGPASLIAWGIMAIIAIYISMIFAELTSMFPEAGGIYEFCKQAYGYFWSFLIGWGTLIAGNITIAMLVVGAVQYLVPVEAPLITIPIALFFLFMFNYIAYKGMKTSAVMLVAFAIITFCAVLGLAVPGALSFNTENFSPFFIAPFSMIIITIFSIAETFFGWETATFLAAETKDGARVMPKALIWGTVIIAIMVLISVFTSLNAINWQIFGGSSAPLSDLAAVHYGEWGIKIFTIIVYLAIIGSVAGWIVSAPRLILAMAADKLFLSQLSKVHPVYKTPYKAIFFQTIVTTVLVIVGGGAYETLLHLLVPLVLILYSAVILSLLFLRIKMPDQPRYFTTPLAWPGCIFVILFLLFLIVVWLLTTHHALQIFLLALSFIVLGVPIYFLLKIYYDPDFALRLNEYISPLSFIFDRFFIIRSVRKEMFDLLENIEGQKILEYGSSVGTLTKDIAMRVGPAGHVFATDVSRKALNMSEWRLRKKGLTNVTYIHDPHQINRVYPGLPKVNAVLSMGMLGYIQDIEKVLGEMHTLMPEQGKICFCDYVDFFHVLPNAGWLATEDTIKEVFDKVGFRVIVKKKKHIFWNYLFIYGIKSEEKVPFA